MAISRLINPLLDIGGRRRASGRVDQKARRLIFHEKRFILKANGIPGRGRKTCKAAVNACGHDNRPARLLPTVVLCPHYSQTLVSIATSFGKYYNALVDPTPLPNRTRRKSPAPAKPA
jgi:hypothetical protein